MTEKTFADFGVVVPAGATGEIDTTCPECSQQRRKKNVRCLSVNVAVGTWLCHHCGWRGGLGSLRQDWKSGYRAPAHQLPAVRWKRNQRRLNEVWAESVSLSHPKAVSARVYLHHRGLGAVLNCDKPMAALRLHPRLIYWNGSCSKPVVVGRYPALVAMVCDPEGQPVALHRTYLKQDGQGKADDVSSPRKMMPPGRPNGLRGGAVRLHPASTRLAVAEGLETALALHVMTDLPAWSTISAHGLQTLALPDGLQELLIGADNDANGTGERAAHLLARHAARRSVAVKITTPGRVGTDWADVLHARVNG